MRAGASRRFESGGVRPPTWCVMHPLKTSGGALSADTVWGSQRPMLVDDRPPQEIGGTDPETHRCPICGEEVDGTGKSLSAHIPRCRRAESNDQQLLSEFHD
jgi:hypothetical protein